MPPSLFAIAMLDEIPDAVIEAQAVGKGDGIKGRVHRVATASGELRIGRYGWKGQVATLDEMVADAFESELASPRPRPGPSLSRRPRKMTARWCATWPRTAPADCRAKPRKVSAASACRDLPSSAVPPLLPGLASRRAGVSRRWIAVRLGTRWRNPCWWRCSSAW
jgi:CxxC motif-containing protein (DUF1111 family)